MDRSGKAVKVDKDGFPDISEIDLEEDQEKLRLEAYHRMAEEQAKHAPIAADGFPEQDPTKVQAWRREQELKKQQGLAQNRTPFASGRPLTDDRWADMCELLAPDL